MESPSHSNDGGRATIDPVPPVPRTKNGFPPRICERCGRPFEWRKKWARDWENVRYCSQACRSGRAG